MLSMIAPRRPGLLLLLVSSLGAACASRAGGKTTEGALQAFRAPPPEGTPSVPERVGRETAGGALSQLASPEGLDRISTVVDATVTRSLEAALRAPPLVHGRGGRGPARSLSLVDRMAHDSAAAFGAAFSDELEHALGPDGRGPLAMSLGATAAQVSGSAVQGVRGELDALLPRCEGEDRRACVEAGVRSLGRAAAAGFVEGIVGSAAWAVGAFAFLVGVVAVLVVQGAVGLVRRRHPERREAHP